jgi:hypothetical protein
MYLPLVSPSSPSEPDRDGERDMNLDPAEDTELERVRGRPRKSGDDPRDDEGLYRRRFVSRSSSSDSPPSDRALLISTSSS